MFESTVLAGINGNDPLTGENFKKLADELLSQIDTAVKNARLNKNVTEEGRDKKIKKLEAKKETAHFLKALAYNDVQTLMQMSNSRAKALNETTGSEGGYLVPEEFENTIVAYQEKYDQLANDCTVHRMNSDVKRLNVLSTDPTTYKVGELAEADSSEPVFAEPVLTAVKYMTIVPWSSEIEEDNELNGLDGLLADRIARSQALKFEQEILNSSTAGSEGLRVVSGVSTVNMATGDDTYAEVKIDYLFDAITKLGEIDEADLQQAKFYMSRSVYSALRKQKSTLSGEYHLPPTGTDAEIGGVQIVLNNRFPKVSDSSQPSSKFILLANLKLHGHVGERSGIRVEVFNSGTVKVGANSLNLITQDAKAMRVVRRRAFTTALQNGLVWIVTAAA